MNLSNFVPVKGSANPTGKRLNENITYTIHNTIHQGSNTLGSVDTSTLEHIDSQPENKFSSLVNGQRIAILPEFTLESGYTLRRVPVAYKTWGSLNENRDNVMIICHALSGSADVADWWGPLLGKGKAFDPMRFFIFCANILGSPYGTASPVTLNPETGLIYGPEFPLTTPRDDVRLHKIILDSMNIKQVAICIGGSMGGMQALEWSFFGPEYVKLIVPIATSAKLSAWCISWNEAQRQSIYSDHKYCDGFYKADETPDTGLAAARMSALLTYRSRDSFESRFSRNLQEPNRPQCVNDDKTTPAEKALLIHNEGHKSKNGGHFYSKKQENHTNYAGPLDSKNLTSDIDTPRTFSAQSYLRYQGDKFIRRFDANCYISLTRKMDCHDISKNRGDLEDVLRSIKQPTCVFGVESDGLFTISEQYELAEHIPTSKMITIFSPDGHDGFLLEFDQINRHILQFIRDHLPEIVNREVDISEKRHYDENMESIEIGRNSVFGELEDKDMIKW